MLDLQSEDSVVMSSATWRDEDPAPDTLDLFTPSQGKGSAVTRHLAGVAVLLDESLGYEVLALAHFQHVHCGPHAEALGLVLPLPHELGLALAAHPDHRTPASIGDGTLAVLFL
jgi:hypothetical protein